MKEKIIKIIPAPTNLYLEYTNEEDPDDPIVSKVICLALTDQGEIKLIDTDDFGSIELANNFKGIIWKDQ